MDLMVDYVLIRVGVMICMDLSVDWCFALGWVTGWFCC